MIDTPELSIETILADETKTTATLTPEEKTFIDTNKDQLTTDERTRFGIAVEPVKPVVREGVTTPAKKEGEDDEELDPDDKKKIGKVVGEAMDPVLKQQRTLQQTTEINGFIQTNPSFAKYSEGIKAQMDAHPTLTVRDAATIVAGDDLMKMGARAEREAKKQADSTKGGGSSARPAGGGKGKDWGTASKEDFAAKRAEVLGRTGA